jgi:hypothetical protein
LSSLPLANVRPSGLKATELTPDECPVRVATRVGFCQDTWGEGAVVATAVGVGDIVELLIGFAVGVGVDGAMGEEF